MISAAMICRKLRIAWSVRCGVLGLLLIALWVRSYWWAEYAFGPIQSSNYLILRSDRGKLSLTITPATLPVAFSQWETHSRSWAEYKASHRNPKKLRRFNPDQLYYAKLGSWGVVLPYTYPVILGITFAALLWLRWRFSLRTLLIAITLVAVGLGVVIALTR